MSNPVQPGAAFEPYEPSRREVRRTILNLVWPATVESLLQMGVGLVNTAIVGHLSAVAISSVGLCNRASMLLAWPLYQAVSTGATVLVAQSMGAGDGERARTHAVQSILFGVVSVALVALVLAAGAVPLLSVFNPEPGVFSTSIRYLRIFVIGLPAVGLMMAAGASLRGAGDTRSPMVVAVLVNIINVVISWILIYGNLGFPAMGVTGSAIATIIAQWIGAVMSLWAVTSRNSILGLSLREPWRFEAGALGQILRVGLPASGESFAWQAASMILTFYVTSFGTEAFAAHQIGLNAESLSYMPTAGFEIASTALVGQAIGARDTHMARRYSRELTTMSAVITVFTAGMLFFFPRQILSLLASDPKVIELGAIYLRIMATAQVPQQVAAIMKGAMRGNGDTRAPMYIAGLGLWGIRLPAAYLMGFTFKMGIVGIWLSMTLDLIVRFGLTWWRYRRIPWVREIGQVNMPANS
ncbi:MAG TPA: MATE family efflux transporter [Firmicutes bacterium]|jgi:putative MATE family efflux protein|nr:MATE family efflux transporter [Bacillota bacterium]